MEELKTQILTIVCWNHGDDVRSATSLRVVEGDPDSLDILALHSEGKSYSITEFLEQQGLTIRKAQQLLPWVRLHIYIPDQEVAAAKEIFEERIRQGQDQDRALATALSTIRRSNLSQERQIYFICNEFLDDPVLSRLSFREQHMAMVADNLQPLANFLGIPIYVYHHHGGRNVSVPPKLTQVYKVIR
ncbi:MAG: hypothetical protein HY007_04325 [Candidatus Sungbacteria bacterium]|nr:hypothetical protein [Candidatus Sungbacteria bacterium]